MADRSKGKFNKKAGADVSDNLVKAILRAEKKDVWITDSGASKHITHRREWFTSYQQLENGGSIFLGDDKECKVIGKGTILIDSYVKGKWCSAKMEDVLHVAQMKKNLFSVGVCTSKGFEVFFRDSLV